MRSMIVFGAVFLSFAVVAPSGAVAQGNSGSTGKPDRPAAERQKERGPGARAAQARGQERVAPPGQARGQARAQEARANAGRGQGAAAARRGGPPPDLDRFNRNLLSRAAEARGRRHANGARVRIEPGAQEVRVVREDGRLLFALDREAADRLGYWRMAVAPRSDPGDRTGRDAGGIFDGLGDEERGNGGSPAFCRSGEGHPVWGREWCVDQGFGLGEDGTLWGRATDIEDVVLRAPRPERDVLDREGLIDVLGDIVFGRLAVQSLVLGADEPLTGRWIGHADGPRILRVSAGDLVVAEIVDADRDDTAEVLLVNLGE